MIKAKLRNSEDQNSWFQAETEYIVLEFYFWLNKEAQIRLTSEEPTLPLQPLNKFSLIGEIDETWKVSSDQNGTDIQPHEFSVPGFWEKFFDDDPQCIQAVHEFLGEENVQLFLK